METKEFRKLLGELAEQSGFSPANSAWLRVTPETIVAVDLQRSAYSQRYYLNFRVWVQGFWNRSCSVSDELLRDTGDIFRREPPEFSDVFDLENSIDPSARKLRREELFWALINPISDAFATREGFALLRANEQK
jgi:hypothetical protein